MHVFGKGDDRQSSLIEWLLRQKPELAAIGDAQAPAFVHRLDAMTSGVILAARQDSIYHALRTSFKTQKLDKQYLALVEGRMESSQTITQALGSRYRRSQRMWVQDRGRSLRGVRPAHTLIEPLQSAADTTLCRVKILTGVRHQIRAHLAHLGHPVVGDTLYGAAARDDLTDRFFLHARKLVFVHPASGEFLELQAELPAALLAILEGLGLQA